MQAAKRQWAALAMAGLMLTIQFGCAGSNYSKGDRGLSPYMEQDFVDMLRMKPGVQVVDTGGMVSVRVRGSMGEPLFVVDGTQLTGAGYYIGSLSSRDVGSFRVLSGADASMYGVRGGNGVIEIRTRN